MIQHLFQLWARLEQHPAADLIGVLVIFGVLFAGLWFTP